MMLVELTSVADAALPTDDFRDFLRLASGFSSDGMQDALLNSCLRSAMASIEARTGKAVFRRDFRWSVTAWRDLARQALPIAPVASITHLRTVLADGNETTTDPSRYSLVTDAHRPMIVSRGFVLPTIPVGGSVEIDFVAGYGIAWDEVPPDLAHAVMQLASFLYDHRMTPSAERSGLPAGVAQLLEPYLPIRLFGGFSS